MPPSHYDAIDDYYAAFIERERAKPNSHINLTGRTLLEMLGDVRDRRVCDLACGTGYLSRVLAGRGATVTGVDLSIRLLEQARAAAGSDGISFIQDDAQTLAGVADSSFDIVVCNLALMDIPDLDQVYRGVLRVLDAGGRFLFSVLHPCFEAPFKVPQELIEVDDQGNFVAGRVHGYADEGYWQSDGTGIRGRVGAYHRTLSTYLNGLFAAGFTLRHLAEPTLPPGRYETLEEQWLSRIPRVLVVDAVYSEGEVEGQN